MVGTLSSRGSHNRCRLGLRAPMHACIQAALAWHPPIAPPDGRMRRLRSRVQACARPFGDRPSRPAMAEVGPRAHWLSHTPGCLARPAGARRDVREMVGSAAPPTLALNPQLPRGFGAHSPSPRRHQQPPFLARWGHPAALLPVVTARGAGRRGAAPAGSDCGTCQMCMPRTRRGELCDLCGCGVWAGTKRAHSRARRDTLTPGRELLAVCKQHLEVLATAQAGFLCRALCVSGAPSLRKDCRLRERRVGRVSLSGHRAASRNFKTSNNEGVSSFVSNRWTYEREHKKNPYYPFWAAAGG